MNMITACSHSQSNASNSSRPSYKTHSHSPHTLRPCPSPPHPLKPQISSFFMSKGQVFIQTSKLSSYTPNSPQTMYETCLKAHITLSKPNSHIHLWKPHISMLLLIPQGQNPSQTAHSLKTDQYDPKTVLEMHLHYQNFNEMDLWFQTSMKPSKSLKLKRPFTHT